MYPVLLSLIRSLDVHMERPKKLLDILVWSLGKTLGWGMNRGLVSRQLRWAEAASLLPAADREQSSRMEF